METELLKLTPKSIETPRLNAVVTAIMDRDGTLSIRNAPRELFDLAKSLETDLAAAQGEVERLKQESKDSSLVTGIAMSEEIRLGKELAQMTENAKGWQKKWYEERAYFDTLWKNACIWKEDSSELGAIRKELAALREDKRKLLALMEHALPTIQSRITDYEKEYRAAVYAARREAKP